MMITNYQELIAAVQKYVQRTDASFMSMLPIFVQNAQNRMTKDLKILDTQIFEDNQQILNDTFVIEKPSGWLSTISLFVQEPGGQPQPLQQTTLQFLMSFGAQTILPVFYADLNVEKIRVNPFYMPKVNFILQYYSVIPMLSADNNVNILIKQIPQVFLYAVLMETAPYLREDERMPTWVQMYGAAKNAVSEEDLGRIQTARPNTH